MKKILVLLPFMIFQTWAKFNFGECSGSKSFQKEIKAYQNNTDDLLIGTIPAGIKGLDIELKSDKDVDIRLYGQNDDKIVYWPDGIINQATEQTETYENLSITYSGYEGTNTQTGYEFIKVTGTTPFKLKISAFGYHAGQATINYSWTGREDCNSNKDTRLDLNSSVRINPNTNNKHFEQEIKNQTTSVVGDIPKDISNLTINLTSKEDIDIQLYDENGIAIIQWPNGILNDKNMQVVDYHGMHIEWSGYNGVDGKTGHEYIKITPKTTEKLSMKVFGYKQGKAILDYTWDKSTVTTVVKAKITGSIVDIDNHCQNIFPQLFNITNLNITDGGIKYYFVEDNNVPVWDKNKLILPKGIPNQELGDFTFDVNLTKGRIYNVVFETLGCAAVSEPIIATKDRNIINLKTMKLIKNFFSR